jgi:long-subunit fatty acid transport protein
MANWRHIGRHGWSALAALAALALTAGPSFASLIYTPNSLGLSARGIGLANALTGDAADMSAMYFNPAGLAVGDEQQLEFGYICDLPYLSGGLVHGPIVRQNDGNRIGYFSTRVDIKRLFPSDWRVPPIGVGFNVAVDNNFMTMMAFDDMRNTDGAFYRYGMANLTMQGAAAVGVTDWLALGVGFHGGFRGQGVVTTRADVSGATSNDGTQMRGSFHPAFLGGLFLHGGDWGVGLTYRDETFGAFQSINVTATPTIANVPLPTLHIPMNFLDTYVPREASVGVTWAIAPAFEALADASWVNWARYERVARRSYFAGSGSQFGTIDIWTPRAAVEAHPVENASVRLGYRYEQTPFRTIGTRYPVPNHAIAGKVILDNDDHVLALGGGWLFDSHRVLDLDVNLDFAYQLHLLPTREAPTSDGYLFRSSGLMHLFTAAVKFAF